MRHGEAVHPDGMSGQADHSRKLTPEGAAEVQLVGKKLNDAGWLPTLGVGSDAARVVETSQALKLNKKPAWLFVPSFYLAGVAAIQKELTFARVLPHKTIIVVGHNPGWSMAVESLTGQPVALKTAAAALLEVEADNWNDALMLEESWSLVKVVGAGM
jgi:phosphohistidine phosphatase